MEMKRFVTMEMDVDTDRSTIELIGRDDEHGAIQIVASDNNLRNAVRINLSAVEAERLADGIYRMLKEVGESKHDHDDSVDWTAP